MLSVFIEQIGRIFKHLDVVWDLIMYFGKQFYSATLLLSIAMTGLACSGSDTITALEADSNTSDDDGAGSRGRVIILGFDGVEPDIVQAMMDEGDLPHLKSLSESGTFAELGSSNPPQSPTAWSSFITSKNPGNHGIYDFLLRTPKNYRPGVGFGNAVKAVLNPDGSVRTPPRFKNIRVGQSFWKTAADDGARCKILSVPFSFPADTLEDGCQLASLGVPDLRGTTSTFFLMSDAFSAPGNLSGGKKVPLMFSGDTATVEIEGLRVPKTRDYAKVPLTVQVNRDEGSITVEVAGVEVTLKEGEWTPWLEWTFDVTPNYKAHAISRIHALEVGEQVRLYMTCLQFDPRKQHIPFTSPESYGKELYERYGFFKTVGWIFDTHALRQDALTEELFLEDVEKTMSWRETLTLDEMDRGDFDLLVSVWTGTDRVSHLFWHHRDELHPLYNTEDNAKYGQAVEDTYRQMDRIVGNVMEKLEPDDLLLILSDHGFHSFRRGFNVNTWLIRNGYLAVSGQSNPNTATNTKPFLQGYDWGKTKAYSLGLGSIFLNQQGREGKGIVKPGDVDALIQEIRSKLMDVTDPETGDKIFSEIYTRDFYQGRATAGAPDLQ